MESGRPQDLRDGITSALSRLGAHQLPEVPAPQSVRLSVAGGTVQLTPTTAVGGRYTGLVEVDVALDALSTGGYVDLPAPGQWEDRTKYEGWLHVPTVPSAITAAVNALERTWWEQLELWQRGQHARAEINTAIDYARGSLDGYLRVAAIQQMTTLDELGHAVFLRELPSQPQAEQVLREGDLLDEGLHARLCEAVGLDPDAPTGRLETEEDVFAKPYVPEPARTEVPPPWTAVPAELGDQPAFAALVGVTRSLFRKLPPADGMPFGLPAGAVQWVVWTPGQRLVFDALQGEWHPPTDLVKVWPVHAGLPQAAEAERVVRDVVLPTTTFEEHFALMRRTEAAYLGGNAGGFRGLRHQLRAAADASQAAAVGAPEELLRPVSQYVDQRSDELSR